MTMPELLRWMRFLSARLRHVRILNGSWERTTTSGVLQEPSPVRQGGIAGVFLDPPTATRCGRAVCTRWTLARWPTTCARGARPTGTTRATGSSLAGYDTEHAALEARGWRSVEWFRGGFLKGYSMGNPEQVRGGTSSTASGFGSPPLPGAKVTPQMDLFA